MYIKELNNMLRYIYFLNESLNFEHTIEGNDTKNNEYVNYKVLAARALKGFVKLTVKRVFYYNRRFN